METSKEHLYFSFFVHKTADVHSEFPIKCHNSALQSAASRVENKQGEQWLVMCLEREIKTHAKAKKKGNNSELLDEANYYAP